MFVDQFCCQPKIETTKIVTKRNYEFSGLKTISGLIDSSNKDNSVTKDRLPIAMKNKSTCNRDIIFGLPKEILPFLRGDGLLFQEFIHCGLKFVPFVLKLYSGFL